MTPCARLPWSERVSESGARLFGLNSRFSRLCQDNLRGCYRLPYVTLSMIRDMNEQTGEGRGQSFLADTPSLLQGAYLEGLNSPGALYQSGLQF